MNEKDSLLVVRIDMYNQEIEEKQEIVQNDVYLRDQYAKYSKRIIFNKFDN
jgi:hypothetical protein